MLLRFRTRFSTMLERRISAAILSFLIVSLAPWNSYGEVEATEAARYSWKKVQPLGAYPFTFIELDQMGTGKFRFQKGESDPVTVNLQIRPSTLASVHSLFLQVDFLNGAKNFASYKKVADLGTKTIRFEDGLKNREVTFNYTEDRTLQEINDFFENLAQQEKNLFEIELALKYDKLGIPRKLDDLEREFNSKRVVAPERFKPILEKIRDDESLINLARKEARKLLLRISKMQPETE